MVPNGFSPRPMRTSVPLLRSFSTSLLLRLLFALVVSVLIVMALFATTALSH